MSRARRTPRSEERLVVTGPDQLTAAWASEVLGADVAAVTTTRVGTGQIGTCFRLALEPGPGADPAGLPASVLVKLPAEDPAARPMLAGAYRGESRFYRDLAATLAVRVPDCHLAAWRGDGEEFTLVLADLAPARQGDQVAGGPPEVVEAAAVELAGLHGPRWCDPALLDVDDLSVNGEEDARILAELWAPTLDLFLARVGDRLSAEDRATLVACGDVVEEWSLARRERFAPVHGDFRLDNLLVGGAAEGQRLPTVHVVDWQTLSLGLPARDLAYLVATSLPTEVRRREEERLVAAYHAALLGHGVAGYPADLAWDDYRSAHLQGPLVSVFGCAYGTPSERGDEMFAVMVQRSCAAIRDHAAR